MEATHLISVTKHLKGQDTYLLRKADLGQLRTVDSEILFSWIQNGIYNKL